MAVQEYLAPATVDDAVAVLGEHGSAARVFAGGTDLIIQIRERRRDVGVMVDVKKIPELTAYGFTADGGLRVGAATPLARLYRDPEVKSRFPALIDSATLIGGVQIQARASLGGNLCNSSPGADSIPTVIVLNAGIEVAGPDGRHTVPAEDFCTGPGQNVLKPGEFVVALHFPAPAPNSGAAFLRFIPRNEMDIAVCNAAANITLSDDHSTFTAARIAIGAVAPKTLFVESAAAALVGQPVGEAAIEAAAAAARAAATPITDMRGSAAQRTHLSGVLVARAINRALERIGKA